MAIELSAPHSLGKLIEWKQRCLKSYGAKPIFTPHSLGKLIEWKQYPTFAAIHSKVVCSRLAGEIN